MNSHSVTAGCFRRTSLAAALLSALAAPSLTHAQVAPGQVIGTLPAGDTNVNAGANLNFVGGLSQIGLGIDRDSRIHVQGSHIASEDALSAVIAQGWLAGGAGGFRVDYNTIPDKDGKPDPDAWVRKLFVAIDSNRDSDKKLTIGAGLESERWFGILNMSRARSKARADGGLQVNDSISVVEGTENGRPYNDTTITTTSTQYFRRAYEYGIGVRAGTLLDDQQLRISLGVDREWGKFSSRQNTVSFGMEKFFAGSPHSVGLTIERYSRSGEFETDHRGTRALLTYRFSFGGSVYANPSGWRDIRSWQHGAAPGSTETRQLQQSAPPEVTMRKETRIVKTTASMTSDAFFELGKADLTPIARTELTRIAATLKTTERSGNIRITGHTCDIGSDAYNLKLSLQRAKAVREFLATTGLPADAFVIDGLGEGSPKYPNTPATRNKNRRVDLEFVRYVDKSEEIEVPVELTARVSTASPPVAWQQEVVEREPIWVRRALRNTVPHKQTVDTYRGATVTQTSSSTRSWVNRNPVTQDDAATVSQGNSATINVLANDADPDGNPLALTAVGAAAHGTVVIAGNAILYMPAAGYVGSDSFVYTVSDGAGGSSTAKVTMSVLRPNQAPTAQNDWYSVPGMGNTRLDVLNNDSDPDGDPLTITSFSQPAFGSVSASGGSLLFQSTTPFAVSTFTYAISDGQGGSSTATVTLVDP